jgi:hypothetical protein
MDDDELDEYIQKGVKGDKDDIGLEGLGGDDDEVTASSFCSFGLCCGLGT